MTHNSTNFATFPHGQASSIEPFQVQIPNEELQTLQQLLKLTPIAAPTYENSLPDKDRRYGVRHDWLSQAKNHWQTSFDWKKHEQHINSFPQFKAKISDQLGTFDIHFVALFSKLPDAVPVILFHGWPGSFLEFLPMLDILRTKYTPETFPYHLVIPSLPGYAFSSPPPIAHDFVTDDVARIMNQLMKTLGFGNGYMVQGGDVGSKVARVLTVNHSECKAIHINFCIMEKAPDATGEISQAEQIGLERTKEFGRVGSAYAVEHATKPSTIGFVLASNPVAILAWVGEKFLDWTDEDPSLDVIIESAALYWLSKCAATSLYPYREFFTPGNMRNPHDLAKYKLPTGKPFGYSWFPKELAPIPRSWAATTGDMTFFRHHEHGGHFAAVEQTKVLLQDLEEFIQESKHVLKK